MIKLQLPMFKKIETQAQNTPGCISFSQGALRVGGVPEKIREYTRDILKTDKADYYVSPMGMPSLREKIALYLQKKHTTTINPQHVFVTHGSVGGLTTIFLSLLEAGDEVILPSPTYPVYQNIVKMTKAVPVFVDAFYTVNDRDNKLSWVFDFERVKATVTPKTKVLLFANPANPTGFSFSEKDLHDMAAFCEQHKIYLVSDEVYENFVFEGTFHSATSLVSQSHYVLRVGSFSKNFSMSGWRVGFVVAPAHMIDTFAAIQGASICCPTAISQYAALYALDHPSLMDAQWNIVKQNRDIAYSGLMPLIKKGILSAAFPTAGFYLFIKTPEKDCNNMVMDILKTANVALAPGSDFGPNSAHSFRLCFARDPELVREGIARLVRYFDGRY
jgi:aspartate/methionine/tyrosine aminotransferase